MCEIDYTEMLHFNWQMTCYLDHRCFEYSWVIYFTSNYEYSWAIWAHGQHMLNVVVSYILVWLCFVLYVTVTSSIIKQSYKSVLLCMGLCVAIRTLVVLLTAPGFICECVSWFKQLVGQTPSSHQHPEIKPVAVGTSPKPNSLWYFNCIDLVKRW